MPLCSPHRRIWIAGATARAAAESAVAGGFHVTAADLFADADLQKMADATQIPRQNYPMGFLYAALSAQADGWMYTGGLENYPELVRQISATLPLWGCPPEVLTAVRDPFHLARLFADKEIPFPQTVASRDSIDGSVPLFEKGRWLKKSVRSCGGLGVSWLAPTTSLENHDEYLQQFVQGTSASGVFLGDRGRCSLLGVTHQILRRDLKIETKHPFGYAGSIGGLPVSVTQQRQWEAIGHALYEAFPLRGLFGVDAIVIDPNQGSAGKVVVPIEVNPRYTASMEVVERLLGRSLVQMHVAACTGGMTNPTELELPTAGSRKRVGKLVVYADHRHYTSDNMSSLSGQANLCHVTDIPAGRQEFHSGQPICTVHLSGVGSAVEILDQLIAAASEVRRSLTM